MSASLIPCVKQHDEQRKQKQKKLVKKKMTSQGWFLVMLLAFILIVCILIAAFPRARQRWCESRQNIFYEKSRVFSTALRSQKDDIILPEIEIFTTSPTVIPFNQPDGTPFTVSKSGNYNVYYTVQLRWNQEATASTAIQSDDGVLTTLLIGSQQQLTASIASAEIVSHQFIAFLTKGDVLNLVCQASVPQSIFVPASDSAVMLTPTTLAGISLTEI